MWAAEKTAAQERHALGFEPAPPVLEQQEALTLTLIDIEPLTLTLTLNPNPNPSPRLNT